MRVIAGTVVIDADTGSPSLSAVYGPGGACAITVSGVPAGFNGYFSISGLPLSSTVVAVSAADDNASLSVYRQPGTSTWLVDSGAALSAVSFIAVYAG